MYYITLLLQVPSDNCEFVCVCVCVLVCVCFVCVCVCVCACVCVFGPCAPQQSELLKWEQHDRDLKLITTN